MGPASLYIAEVSSTYFIVKSFMGTDCDFNWSLSGVRKYFSGRWNGAEPFDETDLLSRWEDEFIEQDKDS